jgi:hypothetical protein
MIGMFRRLPDQDLARLHREPAIVVNYLSEDDHPEDFGPFVDLDVDKAWHAIHFLLTGTAWDGDTPWNFVAVGGTELGEDLGYGPARGFTAAEVRIIAAALESLPPEALLQRFDSSRLMTAEIYPEIWDRPAEQDDTQSYILENYDALRDFVCGAAKSNEALLVYLS